LAVVPDGLRYAAAHASWSTGGHPVEKLPIAQECRFNLVDSLRFQG
jgi:hypothetical protein